MWCPFVVIRLHRKARGGGALGRSVIVASAALEEDTGLVGYLELCIVPSWYDSVCMIPAYPRLLLGAVIFVGGLL